MSYRQFVNSFLPYHPTDSVEKDTLNFKDWSGWYYVG
jgi:hypothetical protein